ncbi:MAG: hypothetical protein WA941_01750 [Nitrososphaeraceae archaeon]
MLQPLMLEELKGEWSIDKRLMHIKILRPGDNDAITIYSEKTLMITAID